MNQIQANRWSRGSWILAIALCWSGLSLTHAQIGTDGDLSQLSSLLSQGNGGAVVEEPVNHDPAPRPPLSSLHASAPELPQGAWWNTLVKRPQRATPRPIPISLESLLVSALTHSVQIQVISDEPLISETAITASDAAFDWTTFLDARWDDLSEPVGNTLTTGGPDRLRDHVGLFELGVRRRNTLGGELEVGQQFGHQNNNSIFFVPNDQGTARLTLSYTQPLLRGAGRVYNTSLTVLAHIDSGIAHEEFSRKLQDHLLEITRAYWSLYLERGTLLQKRRLLERGTEILAELESRRQLDALQRQIVRARSAVESRRADLVRVSFAIRSSEARLRALVNDPAMGDTLSTELLPQEQLSEAPFPVDLRQSVTKALQQRPEISQAVKQVKAASIRMNMSKRESLPLMNVVLETYVAGLEGNSSIGGAFTEQFTEGEPSYSVGLQYELPIWNRAAASKLQRRRLELRRLHHQFRSTVETLKLEVEVAVHEVISAYQALKAKYRAMEAAALEVDYLLQRWQLLPAENGSASLLLEDLLDAQDRLTEAEQGVLESALAFNLAQVAYKKATGTLLQFSQIQLQRGSEGDLPRQYLFKTAPVDSSPITQHVVPVETSRRQPAPSTPSTITGRLPWPEAPPRLGIFPLTSLPTDAPETRPQN